MSKMYCCLFVLLSLCLRVSAQIVSEPVTLLSGQTVEREIAGGQMHTYQIALTTGQFMRIVSEQKGIDVTVALLAPDGKRTGETNLAGVFGQESFSHEAVASGDYQVSIRATVATAPKGTYQVRLTVKAAAMTPEKQRVTAEQLLNETVQSSRRGTESASQTLARAQEVLPLWRELGDQYWEAYTLNHIGNTYSVLRNYAKAIESFEQSLAIRRQINDRGGEGNTLNNLGNAHRLGGRNEKAIEYYKQALAIRQEIKDRVGEGDTLNNLGLVHSSLRRNEEAIEYYKQALEIFREMRNRVGERNAVINLGNLNLSLGRAEAAIEYYEQALPITRGAKDRRGEGEVLNGLGQASHTLSRYEKAIEYLDQALVIHREVKNRVGEGFTLNHLGITYQWLGRFEKAIEYFEQALAIYREVKLRSGEGGMLNNLGYAYFSLNQYEKAIAYYEQSLAISREVNNWGSIGTTLGVLGKAYRFLGQPEKTLEYLNQALAIFREKKLRLHEEYALDEFGNVYRSLGHFDLAISYHEQALRIARELKGLTEEAAALNNLMLGWKALNQPPLAIFFGKQSVNVYQEIRSNIRSLDPESQQSFLKSKEQTYRDLADLLISQGRLPEAELVIRMLKEEEYFEYVRRDETNAPKTEKATLTPEELALDRRYREIADKLTEIGAERTTLLDKPSRTPAEEQRLAQLEADLVIAGQSFQKFLDGLAAEMGKNADTNARAFQLRESQGLMEDLRELGKGVVALYTLVGEDKYRVILTTADFQKGYEYSIKADELNRKVLAFRDVLQNPKLDPLPLAQELYKILVGPVAKDLQGTKAQMVMWSLDGVLRYVPVAALHDGKQYLVERYRTAVFTPASQSRLRVEPSRKWTALGLGVTKAHGLTIPALPGVAEEMRGIIKAEGTNSGVLPGSIKLDEAFTQEAMLTELRKRNPVVHIASHFRFQPGNETNSALLLGDGQFLSLAQIKSLPNVFAGVDLLTLSACNTATGGSGANGKEVEGFGVLAQRQGAKAVVASLWPVADRSTKHLMQEFYKLREAKAEVTKIEALRQAQIKLLRGELQVTGEALAAREIVHEAPKATNQPPFKPDAKAPYAHPYYWAPFILIGNWK